MRPRTLLLLAAVAGSISVGVGACSVDVDLPFENSGTPTPTLPPCELTVPEEPSRLHVSPTGNDVAGDGTPGAPFRTISTALANGPVLFVEGGDYAEDALTITSTDVRIYGNFSSDWLVRDEVAFPTTVNAGPLGVRITGAAGAEITAHLDGLFVVTAPGDLVHAASYGLFATWANLTVNCLSVIAGNGRDGAAGAVAPLLFIPPTAPPPPSGVPTGGRLGGAGGVGCVGGGDIDATGGAGGDGALTMMTGGDVMATAGEPGASTNAAGGDPSANDSMLPGGDGTDGPNGIAGPGGLAGAAAGAADETGWLGGGYAAGQAGGSGHGGGGGGGAGANGIGNGGGGGGGGGGGCGSPGSAGGEPGGGSIGIYLWHSTVSGVNLLVTTGEAGDGGIGAPGVAGGPGSAGALGAQVPSAVGGSGGNGGFGGPSGGGGGGAGGASVGIFTAEASSLDVPEDELLIGLGLAGAGGAGGPGSEVDAGNPGADGEAGILDDRYP